MATNAPTTQAPQALTPKDSFAMDYNAYAIINSFQAPLVDTTPALGGIVPNIVSGSVSPTALTNGQTSSEVSLVNGFYQSSNFVTGVSGWIIRANGDVEFNNGVFRGALSATSIDIPDTTTTASFHVDALGNMWIGATTFAAAPASITNLGDAFFHNIHASGVFSTTVFEKDTVSAVGGKLLVTNADALSEDMTAADNSTLTITGATTFAVNDILEMKNGLDDEFLRVTNVAGAPTYVVTRDLAGSYAPNANPAWEAGTAVVKEGKSDGVSTFSGGFLQLFGEGTNSPFYSVYKRTGVAYNALTEVIRLGNLNGIGGNVIDTFGIFIGDFATNQFLQFDEVSGDLIVNGSNLSFDFLFGNGADGDVTITTNTTLTSDVYYNNLTLDPGVDLDTGQYRVWVRDTTTFGTGSRVLSNGNPGGAGTAGGNGPAGGSQTGSPGTGGTAGAAVTAGYFPATVAGVAGNGGQFGSNLFPSGGGSGDTGVDGNDQVDAVGVDGLASPGGGFGGGSDVTANGSNGAASNPGTVTPASTVPFNAIIATLGIDFNNPGSLVKYRTSASSGGTGGGGGGGRGVSNLGWGGYGGGGGGIGSPGGFCFFASRNIVGTGSIEAVGGDGGAGGNGGAGDTGNNCGGGGAGPGGSGSPGGVLVLMYSTKAATVTTSVAGGAAGAAGTPGAAGGAGKAGGTPSAASAGPAGTLILLTI